MRTRTMGTPFWVRTENDEIVVTTAAGNDRSVRWDEIDATWAHIARGDPRSVWRSLTNNSSYLESIYDDLTEAGVAAMPARPTVAERRLEECTAEYVKLRTRYRSETTTLRAESESMTTQLLGLRMELASAKEALENERRWGGKTSLDQLKADLAAEREQRTRLELSVHTSGDEAAKRTRKLESSVAALEVANRELQAQLGEAIDERDEALAGLTDTAQRLRLAEMKLKAAEEKPTAGRTKVTQKDAGIEFTQMTLALGATDRISEPREREALITASQRLADDPDRAVLECRRVLERCSRSMWQDAYPGQHPPSQFHATMADIRESGVVPPPDWHLMKNLYSRSSDIVHNGGGNRQAALWIWLGTAEVAELVGAKRPQS
jgi:hypothetical protein